MDLVCTSRIDPHTPGLLNTEVSPSTPCALSRCWVVAVLALWPLAAWAIL